MKEPNETRRRAAIRELLIGDNAFIGVSHLSQERARDRKNKLNNVDSILEVINNAFSCGATGYTFSTHPTNIQILNTLRTSGATTNKFDVYPVVPYAEGYVRLANEKGMSGLASEILSRLSLSDKARAFLQAGSSALKLDPVGMMKTWLDAELSGYLNAKPENATLRSVLLCEVITDLLLGFQSSRLFEEFAEHVREKYHAKPGFVTYNLARFVELFRKAELPLEDVVIMTPFNSIGFQMSPSRESCETCLSSLREGDVIAMSIVAGGYLDLDEAFEYIRGLPTLSGIAVGVSSKRHAQETFTRFGMLQRA